MGKLYCSELMGRVANHAVQIYGGYGLMKDYGVERFYRDQKLLDIGEGTSEIQRLVISRLYRMLKPVGSRKLSSGCRIFFRRYAMSSSVILAEEEDHILTLTLNRPEAMNAFNYDQLETLAGHIDAVRYRPDIRVVILTGAGEKSFCSGADLKERATLSDLRVAEFLYKQRNLFTAIEKLNKPVIAAVNGVAFGGGTEIALACDIRIAAKTASLGLTETKLAIIPGAGGTQRLPRIVGLGKAKELIYTGKRVTRRGSPGHRSGQPGLRPGSPHGRMPENGGRNLRSRAAGHRAGQVCHQRRSRHGYCDGDRNRSRRLQGIASHPGPSGRAGRLPGKAKTRIHGKIISRTINKGIRRDCRMPFYIFRQERFVPSRYSSKVHE